MRAFRASAVPVVLAAILSVFSTSLPNEADAGVASTATIDSIAQALFAVGNTPGMSVAVVRGDSTIYAKGFGLADRGTSRPVTPETMFYIASTTKSFTALAAALLAGKGTLDLDAPLARYLPRARLHAPLDPGAITLRELLTHTHGIGNEGPVVIRTAFTGEYTHDRLVELLAAHPAAPAGRAFEYGNIGYNTIGLILDAGVTNGWKAVVRREVLAPIGMSATHAELTGLDPARLALPYEATATGFERTRLEKTDATMHAAGGHVASALDLALYLRVHLNDGRVGERQVFPAAVMRMVRSKQADQAVDFGEIHRFGWGLGWDLGVVSGDTLVHRFGSFPGFRSHVSFLPQHGLGVVVLVNGGGMGSTTADAVALSIYDVLRGRPDAAARLSSRVASLRERATKGREMLAQGAAKRAARNQPLPHPLSAYAGTYESPEYGRMTWREVGGALEARFGVATSAAEVFEATTNKLRVELLASGSVAQFEFPPGADRAASLAMGGMKFDRVAAP